MNFVLNGSTPKTQRAFIKKPIFQNFNSNNLIYLDVLTFTAVKSFDNPNEQCFPSYETIAEKARLSKDFVMDSIQRLEDANYLSVYRNPKFRGPNRSYPNKYFFPEFEVYNPIPLEVLNVEDLTAYEKAMLLLLRQFAASPSDIHGSMDDFSNKLGLTKRTIYKQYLSLNKKAYLDKGRLRKHQLTTLLKIDWSYPEHLKINKISKPIVNLLIA